MDDIERRAQPMAQPPLALFNEVVVQQALASSAYKRSMAFNRIALQHSRKAEDALRALLSEYGIELEIRNA